MVVVSPIALPKTITNSHHLLRSLTEHGTFRPFMVPESAILICGIPLLVYFMLIVYIKRRERKLARRRRRPQRGVWRPYVGKSKYVLLFFSVLDYRNIHRQNNDRTRRGSRDNILWWWWQGMIRHHDMLAPFFAPDDGNGKSRGYHAGMMIAKYAATIGVCTMLFHLVRRRETSDQAGCEWV